MAHESGVLDMMERAASEKTASGPAPAGLAHGAAPLRLLSYVHLRNIHGSTGAGRTARQIVEHLGQRDDVSLRVLADASDSERILPLVQEPWTSYRYHLFEADTSRQQAQWFLLDRPAAESYWPEAQVVFCTGESYVPATKAKLAVTMHDAGYFDEGVHHRDLQYWKTHVKWRLLFSKLDRRADMFHTVSQFSAERLAHFFPQFASRIRWVYNGVTPHFFGPVPQEGRDFVERAGLNSRPYVLVPGGLHFRKNAELILSASAMLLGRFPELVIAVVNHSNPMYAEQSKSLGERFRLLGFVPDEALHALYAAAQVVWYPSRYEGFGLPIVEAMACGAPVVGSNSSSIPEIAGDAAMLVAASDAAAHANAITELLRDSRERAKLAAAGLARAPRFTWANCAAELKRDFDSLL
jgi:glycosyltransferase involved in cell wall biosynthesis